MKIVYAPTQIASDSQLFAQQLKAAGYKGDFFATDGSFDNTSFTFVGAYVSFFATDIYQLKAVHSIVHDFAAKYGKTTPFGAPSWVAAQALAMAISQSCTDGKTSRAEVRADLAKVKMANFAPRAPDLVHEERRCRHRRRHGLPDRARQGLQAGLGRLDPNSDFGAARSSGGRPGS